MRLPDQYDTILLEDGINISKGQKQLLTIARAMIKDSPLLILDEATSSVDTRTELVIQKAVELGAEGVIPVEMSRCVVKVEEKKKKSKQSRWQAISESAAKQSKRTVIPEVFEIMSFKNALKMAEEMDLFIVPYESKEGMKSTKNALSKMQKGMKVGILIGPEGGFDEKEIAKGLKSFRLKCDYLH